jgi:hypothetical protein
MVVRGVDESRENASWLMMWLAREVEFVASVDSSVVRFAVGCFGETDSLRGAALVAGARDGEPPAVMEAIRGRRL